VSSLKIYLALDGTKDVTQAGRAAAAGRIGPDCLVCVLPTEKDPDDLTTEEILSCNGDARPALDEWITAIEVEADGGARNNLKAKLRDQVREWVKDAPANAGEIRARLCAGMGLTESECIAWIGELPAAVKAEGEKPKVQKTDGPMFPNQPAPLGKAMVGEEGRAEISNFITEYRNTADKDKIEKASPEEREQLRELRELDRERLKLKRAQSDYMRRKEAKETVGEYPEFAVDKKARLEGLATTWKCVEKAAMVAKNTDAMRSEVRGALKSWPMKLISGSLFADDERDLPDREFVPQKEGTLQDVFLGPPVRMVDDSTQFLSLLHDYGRVKFNRGQDADKNNYVGVDTLYSNICSSPQTRIWLEVERFPHAPAMPAHYYAYRGTQDDYAPTGKYLADLLGFFDQVIDPYHRAIFAAAVATVFWGGPYGKRPFFFFHATGQDSGKTTAAEMITFLVGGFAHVNFTQRDEERLKERILSDDFAGTRCLLADNVIGRVESPLLAELATASWISGKKLAVGEAKKPNSLCVFMTGNNPQLVTDLTTRTFFVKFEPIQSIGDAGSGKDITERSDWSSRLRDFLRDHSRHVMADCLMILSQDVGAADFKGITKERNADWVQGVLVKVMANPLVKAAIGVPSGGLEPKDVLIRNQAFRDSVNEELDEATRFLQALVERVCEWHNFKLASENGTLAHSWPREPVFIRASPPEKKRGDDEDDESRQNIATVWKSVIRGDVNPTWVGRRVNMHIEGGRLKGLKAKRTGVKRGYVLDPELVVRFIAERAYVAKHGLQDSSDESVATMGRYVSTVVEEWRQGAAQNGTTDATSSAESVTA
jgi:hypothetical protein